MHETAWSRYGREHGLRCLYGSADLVYCQLILLSACSQVTALELMSWRALLQLQPEAVLMLARASVHTNTIVRVEKLRYEGSQQSFPQRRTWRIHRDVRLGAGHERCRMQEVLRMCGDDVSLHNGYQLLERLLQHVTGLPAGQYVLVHRAGTATVLCFQALAEPLQIEEVCTHTFDSTH